MNKEEFQQALLDEYINNGRIVSDKTHKGIKNIINKMELPGYDHLHYSNFKNIEEYNIAREKHNLDIKKKKSELLKRKRQIKKEDDGFNKLLGIAKGEAYKQISGKRKFLDFSDF